MDIVETLKPGDQMLMAVGWPGPIYEPCEVVEVGSDGRVKIKFQVYGKGPFHEEWIAPGQLRHPDP